MSTQRNRRFELLFHSKIGRNRLKNIYRAFTPSTLKFLFFVVVLSNLEICFARDKKLGNTDPKITRLVGILKRMQNGMRNNYCLIWELSYGFWGNFSCVFGAQKWWPYSGMGVHNLNCCCLSSIGSVAIKQQFADLETKFNSILHTISKLLLKSAHNLQQRWKNFYSTKSRLGSFFLTGKSWGCASVINRKLFPSLIKISWIYELKTGGKKLVMSFLLLLPLLPVPPEVS